jgi:hypothetical protein
MRSGRDPCGFANNANAGFRRTFGRSSTCTPVFEAVDVAVFDWVIAVASRQPRPDVADTGDDLPSADPLFVTSKWSNALIIFT